jgi:hypothetical protein
VSVKKAFASNVDEPVVSVPELVDCAGGVPPVSRSRRNTVPPRDPAPEDVVAVNTGGAVDGPVVHTPE